MEQQLKVKLIIGVSDGAASKKSTNLLQESYNKAPNNTKPANNSNSTNNTNSTNNSNLTNNSNPTNKSNKIQIIEKKKKKKNQPITNNILKCYYTNATSLIGKWNEFKSTIAALDPDIISITETWFNDSSNTNLGGYNIYFKNREESRGGGVVLYIKNYLDSFEVENVTIKNPKSENIWCSIRIGKENILIGCIYRPPYSKREINLEINKTIKKANKMIQEKKYTALMVCGDFNFSDIVWDNLGGTLKGNGRPSSRDFLDLVNSKFLSQPVLEPTLGDNFLDLILVNDPTRIYNVIGGQPISSSPKEK